MYLSVFLAILVLIKAEDNSNGFCTVEDKSCSEVKERFILYDVNPPEGFNLRRDVYMRYAIMLAEAKKQEFNWKLVLPPWNNLYHWKTSYNKPIPWGNFFDLNSLKTYSPVIEMYELFPKTSGKRLIIDRLYVLEHFPNAFEDGVFNNKWVINKDCEYQASFWGYKNITVNEVICVKYQGKVSQLWDVINTHSVVKYIMIAHAEIPLHDNYGTKSFWDCRRSMKFNEKLLQRARDYISEVLRCNKECNYLGIHWRRQDFARARKNDVPSIKGTVKQIDKAIKKLNKHIVDVFVASDGEDSELLQLDKELSRMGYKAHFFLPSLLDLNEYKDGGIAIIEQIICSYSKYFIGTHESTFSFRIQEEREILGYDSDTTFNRFCPDSGWCEKPSRWTIIN